MELQEVKNQIMDRTGLDEQKALSAIAIVMDALKSKLPDSIASQLDGVLTGEDEFSYKEIMDDKLKEMQGTLGDKFNDVKKSTEHILGRIFHKKKEGEQSAE